MRKYLIALAAAASTVAIAAPASAQNYGGSSGYGYGSYDRGYGNYDRGYGYENHGRGDRYNRGGYESRQLIVANRERMAKIHAQIRSAAARGMLNPGEAARLDREAAQFDRELDYLARDGMTGQEGAIFDQRADRLAQEVQARTGYGRSYGYGGYGRW